MSDNDDDIPIDHLDDETDDVIPYIYSITSYGADYPVDGLVKRINAEDIYIPEFQRGYVWSLNQASRFIESLLLGLPVPGIFVAKDEETKKLLVIDGQQRLKSLQFFYNGMFRPTGKEFRLSKVQDVLEGVTYESLSDEQRRELDDTIIHATVVKQDQPSEDNSSIYHIFERLNTGATQLRPQEIRACIYHGKFANLLKELNENAAWRAIYGKPSNRMRDRELILRFLALYFDRHSYKRPMKEFLNIFMGRNRNLQKFSREELEMAFVSTIESVLANIGDRAFRRATALNAAIFDAVMVGFAERLSGNGAINLDAAKEAYVNLLEDEAFRNASERATADEESVKSRIERAIEVIGAI